MNTAQSSTFPEFAYLQLEPDSGNTEDNQWQHECHVLLKQINRELEGLDERVEPELLLRSEIEARGKKAGDFELFNNLLIQSGLIESIVNRCWGLIQSFFDRHSGSSGTLVFPDGSQVNVCGMSTEQALELIMQTRAASQS